MCGGLAACVPWETYKNTSHDKSHCWSVPLTSGSDFFSGRPKILFGLVAGMLLFKKF
jgi:hypothetical protein